MTYLPFLKSGQPIHTTGKNLAGLWRPSFVKTDNKLYVFGGGGNATHDLHVLHFEDMRWETLHAVEGQSPSKRYGHTATKWNNSFIIFGGCNEFQDYCNDVHIFNLDTMTWTQPNITGSVSARYLHTAVVHDDQLFVYGGFAKSSECTYVLEEMNILDLKTMTWSRQHEVQPRYNHSATLIGSKMYIYGGKDEHGNTVSDLFVVNLQSMAQHFMCHLVLSGAQNTQMALMKSQHFCDAVCGKLLVFGRFMTKNALQQPLQQQQNTLAPQNNNDSNIGYTLWMLDLDTLEWQRQACDVYFDVGGWNYFTIIHEVHTTSHIENEDFSLDYSPVITHHLLFLGNTDPYRPQGYDHFRDALMINGESLGLYDIAPSQYLCEFAQMLDNPELSDFTIVPADGPAIQVHQVILMTRWPHFRNVYKSGMVEALERRIHIPESHKVVLAFLKYLYSDQLDDNEPWHIVCDLLVIANMYLQHRLKKLCCQRLYQRHMSVDSCMIIFEKAILADEIGLKLLTLNFMFRHYGSVLKSNVLTLVPLSIQHAFLEAVPEEAVLEVGRSRFLASSSAYLPASSASTTASIADLTAAHAAMSSMMPPSSSSSTSSMPSTTSTSVAATAAAVAAAVALHSSNGASNGASPALIQPIQLTSSSSASTALPTVFSSHALLLSSSSSSSPREPMDSSRPGSGHGHHHSMAQETTQHMDMDDDPVDDRASASSHASTASGTPPHYMTSSTSSASSSVLQSLSHHHPYPSSLGQNRATLRNGTNSGNPSVEV